MPLSTQVAGGAAPVNDRDGEVGHGSRKIKEGAGYGDEIEPLLHRGLPGVVVGPAPAPCERTPVQPRASPPATVPEEPGGHEPRHLLLICNDMKMHGGLLR